MNITSNGDYDINVIHPNVAIEGSGDFGGGTLTLSVINPLDNVAIPVKGGEWIDDFEDVWRGNKDRSFRFTLTGATSPNLNIYTGQYHG